MTGYPFSGQDYFTHPPSYSYADCARAGYVDDWRASRAAGMAALRRAVPRQPVTSAEPPQDTALALGAALAEMLAALRAERADAARALLFLSPFIMKFEVHRRLFRFYGADGRRCAASPPASLGDYVRFAACLAWTARAGGGLKPLSTLLKLCDTLLSVPPADYTAEEIALLLETLALEDRLVREWEDHADRA